MGKIIYLHTAYRGRINKQIQMPIFLSDLTVSKVNTFSPGSFSYGDAQTAWSVQNDLHTLLALISYTEE